MSAEMLGEWKGYKPTSQLNRVAWTKDIYK